MATATVLAVLLAAAVAGGWFERRAFTTVRSTA